MSIRVLFTIYLFVITVCNLHIHLPVAIVYCLHFHFIYPSTLLLHFCSLLYRFFSSVSADIAVVVYAVGIMEGNEEVWDYVWEQSRQTRVASEAEVMMNALAYTQEPWLLWRWVGYCVMLGGVIKICFTIE